MTNAYQQQLIESLLKDAEKGRNGATLQVQCCNSDDTDTTFCLHPNIATESSGYFERFPTPESRRIPEIDAETFEQCRKFMYTGSCDISHSTVAATLAAAELLLIQDLTEACFDFLQGNLDYENYETVHDLAERFRNPHLAHQALAYSTPNAAKKELVLKKRKLAGDIQELDENMKRMTTGKRNLVYSLEKLEEQWTAILQAEVDAAVPPSASNEESQDYPFEKAKSLGAVGRLIVSPDAFPIFMGRGVSMYYPEGAKKPVKTFSDDDAFISEPPPPPTKEQYEELGITHAYCSFNEAMEDAKPGDRLYFGKGTHEFRGRYDPQTINQSLEMVALPGEEAIIQLHSNASFKVGKGSLRLKGLIFRHIAKHEQEKTIVALERDSDKAEAMIDFRSEDGDIFIQDCTFDMRTNASFARSSRVSGVFLKQGRSARIEGNKFVGGGGSALVVLNDPTLKFSQVEINRNAFVNTGQPSFAETRATTKYTGGEWKTPRCRKTK